MSTWTTEKPAKANTWHWWREKAESDPIAVRVIDWCGDGALFVRRWGSDFQRVAEIGGEWQPVEPAKE